MRTMQQMVLGWEEVVGEVEEYEGGWRGGGGEGVKMERVIKASCT